MERSAGIVFDVIRIEQADADEMAEMMKELEGASEEEISALLLSESGQLE